MRFNPDLLDWRWQLDPVLLLPLLVVGVLYAVGAVRLNRRRHSLDRRGVALFAAGYVTLAVALISPLHSIGEQLFSVHMVQHLLLSLVAAPLLLSANSMATFLWALPSVERHGVAHLARAGGPLRRGLRLLCHPAIAWTLFTLTQWLWHQSSAYDLALNNLWVHYLEHLTFFLSAILFWWPVIGAAPQPSPLSYPYRIGYTFLAWIPMSVLGAGITLSNNPLYPHYVAWAQTLGVSALADQQLAGLIMWIPGDALFVTILLILCIAFLNDEERAEARIDRELDARELAAAQVWVRGDR